MKLPEINSERWLSLVELSGEEWATIPGHKGAYQVSTMGRVRCIGYTMKRKKRGGGTLEYRKSPFIKVSKDNGNGYYTIIIESRHYYVHRLVAQAFVPNLYGKPDIDHINGIRFDNRAENLRWVTPLENMRNLATIGNVTAGGMKKRKGVYQIDPITGKIVNEWSGIMDAAWNLGISRNVIGESANCRRGKRTAGGYVFVFTKDYKPENDYRVFTHRNGTGVNMRSVIEYKDGSVYRVFRSVGSAASHLGCSMSAVTKICREGREKKKAGRKQAVPCGLLVYLKDAPAEDQDRIIQGGSYNFL